MESQLCPGPQDDLSRSHPLSGSRFLHAAVRDNRGQWELERVQKSGKTCAVHTRLLDASGHHPREAFPRPRQAAPSAGPQGCVGDSMGGVLHSPPGPSPPRQMSGSGHGAVTQGTLSRRALEVPGEPRGTAGRPIPSIVRAAWGTLFATRQTQEWRLCRCRAE